MGTSGLGPGASWLFIVICLSSPSRVVVIRGCTFACACRSHTHSMRRGCAPARMSAAAMECMPLITANYRIQLMECMPYIPANELEYQGTLCAQWCQNRSHRAGLFARALKFCGLLAFKSGCAFAVSDVYQMYVVERSCATLLLSQSEQSS